MLASDLSVGLAGPKDTGQALQLYERACNSGKAVAACYFEGQMLIEGDGVKADATRGTALVRKGCRGGDQLACEYLEGVRYCRQTSALTP